MENPSEKNTGQFSVEILLSVLKLTTSSNKIRCQISQTIRPSRGKGGHPGEAPAGAVPASLECTVKNPGESQSHTEEVRGFQSRKTKWLGSSLPARCSLHHPGSQDVSHGRWSASPPPFPHASLWDSVAWQVIFACCNLKSYLSHTL